MEQQHSSTTSASPRSEWWEIWEDVLQFAGVLVEAGQLPEPADVLYFMEKPWKWSEAWSRWALSGKPYAEEEGWDKWVDSLWERDPVIPGRHGIGI